MSGSHLRIRMVYSKNGTVKQREAAWLSVFGGMEAVPRSVTIFLRVWVRYTVAGGVLAPLALAVHGSLPRAQACILRRDLPGAAAGL